MIKLLLSALASGYNPCVVSPVRGLVLLSYYMLTSFCVLLLILLKGSYHGSMNLLRFSEIQERKIVGVLSLHSTILRFRETKHHFGLVDSLTTTKALKCTS